MAACKYGAVGCHRLRLDVDGGAAILRGRERAEADTGSWCIRDDHCVSSGRRSSPVEWPWLLSAKGRKPALRSLGLDVHRSADCRRVTIRAGRLLALPCHAGQRRGASGNEATSTGATRLARAASWAAAATPAVRSAACGTSRQFAATQHLVVLRGKRTLTEPRLQETDYEYTP